MTRLMPPLLALAVLIASGVAQGVRSHRWSGPDHFDARVSAVGRVPETIGTWRGQDLPMDRRVQEAAGIAKFLMRRYEDRRTGRVVTALLVGGRPGPIAVHTPEVCYEGSGYEPTGSRSKVTVGDGPAADQFWVSQFRKERAGFTESLQIDYAWSEGGTWVASDYPRFRFGGAPVLYKLYVVREVPPGGGRPGDDPAVDFLKAALPVLRASLAAAP